MPGPAGILRWHAGATTSASDTLRIRLFGRGAHGSMPQASIDPVVMAASTVLRLQTIVSREIAAQAAAVVTVGILQAGTSENIIPDEALLGLNIRTFDPDVRKHVLGAIERIVNSEAAASGAPRMPEITRLGGSSSVMNDPAATKRVVEAFNRHFPPSRVQETIPSSASEDFSSFGSEWQVPAVFWFVEGTDPQMYAAAEKAGKLDEIPTNHNPKFAPVIHPTLETGIEAAVVASQAWFAA